MSKSVIINADDFGLTENCTKAIFESFNKNIITDTTMVANGSSNALEMIMSKKKCGHPIFEHIGIHLNLTEGRPITKKITECKRLVDANGFFCNELFKPRNYIKRLTTIEIEAIYLELKAQVEFLEMLDVYITHIDSHQHVHYNPQILKIVEKISREFEINKIRPYKNTNVNKTVTRLYGNTINTYLRWRFETIDWFGNATEYNKLKEGLSEIMVHPDYDINGELINRIKKYNVDGMMTAIGNRLTDDLAFLNDEEYVADSYKEIFEKRK